MTIAMEGDEDKGGEPAVPLPQDRLPEPSGAPFRLLDGVRVLDLTTSIAGPYATTLLIDGQANAPRAAPPGLAERGRAVLYSLLGMADHEIARLEEAGVVGRTCGAGT